jgi:hypothetical protein
MYTEFWSGKHGLGLDGDSIILKLPFCVIKHHAMKTYGLMEVLLHA